MMNTTIYLSRHGQTKQNEMKNLTGSHWQKGWERIPRIRQLTKKGEAQARVLGNYLSYRLLHLEEVDPADIMMITSNEERSVRTGYIVSKILGLPDCNTRQYPGLREQVPKEWVKENSEVRIDWYSQLRSIQEIAESTLSELDGIARQYHDKRIIATLHNALNEIFLRHIGSNQTGFGNCGLVVMQYDDRGFRVVEPYRSNEELTSDLEEAITLDD